VETVINEVGRGNEAQKTAVEGVINEGGKGKKVQNSGGGGNQ